MLKVLYLHLFWAEESREHLFLLCNEIIISTYGKCSNAISILVQWRSMIEIPFLNMLLKQAVGLKEKPICTNQTHCQEFWGTFYHILSIIILGSMFSNVLTHVVIKLARILLFGLKKLRERLKPPPSTDLRALSHFYLAPSFCCGNDRFEMSVALSFRISELELSRAETISSQQSTWNTRKKFLSE